MSCILFIEKRLIKYVKLKNAIKTLINKILSALTNSLWIATIALDDSGIGHEYW